MPFSRFARAAKNFLLDESGPTAVEYCVILMLILLGVLTVVQILAGVAGGSLDDSSQQIDQAFNGS